jgi:hypothetical protein
MDRLPAFHGIVQVVYVFDDFSPFGVRLNEASEAMRELYTLKKTKRLL